MSTRLEYSDLQHATYPNNSDGLQVRESSDPEAIPKLQYGVEKNHALEHPSPRKGFIYLPLIWGVDVLVAFLLGGGIAAGVMSHQKKGLATSTRYVK